MFLVTCSYICKVGKKWKHTATYLWLNLFPTHMVHQEQFCSRSGCWTVWKVS